MQTRNRQTAGRIGSAYDAKASPTPDGTVHRSIDKVVHLSFVVSLLSIQIRAEHDDVATAYLNVLHAELVDANQLDKELLVGKREFVDALLQDCNHAMHHTSSEIIGMLSRKSPQRSAKLIDLGVGRSVFLCCSGS
jgi:hypothetical protein